MLGVPPRLHSYIPTLSDVTFFTTRVLKQFSSSESCMNIKLSSGLRSVLSWYQLTFWREDITAAIVTGKLVVKWSNTYSLLFQVWVTHTHWLHGMYAFPTYIWHIGRNNLADYLSTEP